MTVVASYNILMDVWERLALITFIMFKRVLRIINIRLSFVNHIRTYSRK